MWPDVSTLSEQELVWITGDCQCAQMLPLSPKDFPDQGEDTEVIFKKKLASRHWELPVLGAELHPLHIDMLKS